MQKKLAEIKSREETVEDQQAALKSETEILAVEKTAIRALKDAFELRKKETV